MNSSAWKDVQEIEEEQASFERARPVLVSLHFVRSTLRRRLVVCVLSPVLGLLAAIGFMAAFPPPHAAQASLVLTADEQQEATSAMDTNVSLLKTQTLATRVTDQLGLSMTPEQFLGTVTVESTGTELMSLTLTAPDDAEAVRRLDGLTSQYLKFRGEQLTYQTQVLVDGLQDRIKQGQADSLELTAQIDKLSRTSTTKDPGKLNDAISQRAAVQARIDELEQKLEDATLQTGAVLASSRVLDPPKPVPGRALRNLVLGLGSGVIGGTALGWGSVLFVAITSSHLRRRADLAATIGADVRTSVARSAPLPVIVSWLPGMHTVDRRRAEQRDLAGAVISAELVAPRRHTSLAVAGIDNARELTHVVADTARELARSGYSVTVIDLTGRGSRSLQTLTAPAGASGSVAVLRPRGLPALTSRTDDLLAAGVWEEGDETPEPDLSEVTLVAAELEPATGAGYLSAWADRAVLVVTAGRTSVEKARTVSDQVRGAGLDLRFAVLLGTDRDDHSMGTAPSVDVPTYESGADGADGHGSRWAEAL